MPVHKSFGLKALAAIGGLAAAMNGSTTEPIPNAANSMIFEIEIAALSASMKKDHAKAIELMKKATALEEATTAPYGPPGLIKPSHELFGEILLEIGRPKEAQAEFRRALTAAPKRARSLLGLGRASVAAGDKASASEAYSALRAIWHRADPNQLALATNSDTGKHPQ